MNNVQLVTKDSPTIAKLDEIRSQLALLTMKHSNLTKICEELCKYRLSCTPSKLRLYLEEHPITRFEKEMAKNIEACCNHFENLYNSYQKEKRISVIQWDKS